MGDPKSLKSGREFAAWLGLVPGQTGSGGKKVQLLGISKRGDAYVRTLLIQGARSVLAQKKPSKWIQQIQMRRPSNMVAVALANKMARMIWAVLAHQRHIKRSMSEKSQFEHQALPMITIAAG
jgi:transposase